MKITVENYEDTYSFEYDNDEPELLNILIEKFYFIIVHILGYSGDALIKCFKERYREKNEK